jgi:two-component system, NarL family, invasion response regulator UvrY
MHIMRVLLVDDHSTVRAGLRHLLRATLGAEVREAATALAALEDAAESRPDLVILDLNLAGLGGLMVLPRLREQGLRVLVLTMHAEPLYARRALAAGALGFLSKNADSVELLSAIRRVADGKPFIEQRIAQEMALQRLEGGDREMALTDRDLELLRLMASGCSLTQMATSLNVSYKTVANSMALIKKKVGATNTVDLVRLAMQICA